MKKLFTLILALGLLVPGFTQNLGVQNQAVVVTFSATPVFNANTAGIFIITLTGNVTSLTIPGASVGETITFVISQDSSGSRTWAWPATVKNAPAISATASASTTVTMNYDGTNWQTTGSAVNSAVGLNAPVITGGLTASGSAANDFSGSTGAFKPSTGTFTFQAAAVAATAGANNFDLSASSGTFKTPTGVATFGGSSNVFTTAITATGTAPSDGIYYVPLGACGLTLTTGTWAANANGGTSLAAGPFILKAQTSNPVLQGTTTAAANTFDLSCDITPPTRLTSGKGVTINDVVYAYGYQTTALTTIGTATISTVAYSAPGGSAAGTVASAGGSLTVTAGTSHSTPGATTTSGQCYVEKQAFGTPYAAIVDNQRLTLQNTFAQSAAASTILQICGVWVHYSNINSL